MKRISCIIIISLCFYAARGQIEEKPKKSYFVHGGVGIPILLATTNNDNIDLFKVSNSFWNAGFGVGYSFQIFKGFSYILYAEFRSFDFDVGKFEDAIQVQYPVFTVIPYNGADMFLSYGNLFVGMEYAKSFNKLSFYLMIKSGPSFYGIPEPTIKLKQNGSNNILIHEYNTSICTGFGISPEFQVGANINENMQLLLRTSYFYSSVNVKYIKHSYDLIDLKTREDINSGQTMNNILFGVGLRVYFE